MKIGYATSSDGINWTVENNDSCVLDLGQAGNWDSRQVRMASVQHFNDTLRMWYGGIDEAFGFNNFKIGYAWCYDPITGTREFGDTEQMHTIISPNPCTDVTKLQFRMPVDGNLIINLYDISGKKIKQLINKKFIIGIHEKEIDVSSLTSGIYFCTLKTNEGMQTKKLIKVE